MLARSSAPLLALAASLALASCQGESDDPRPSRGVDERTIVTIQSYVYAEQDDTTAEIAGRIRDQLRSVSGTLRSLRVTGSNKEVANTPGDLLYREPLVVVRADGRESITVRVWFRYSDEVLASAAIPRGLPLLVGGLHRQDEDKADRILIACTDGTGKERELRGRLQTAFDGTLSSCQDAILAEQAVIDAARVRLHVPDDEVVPEEVRRAYIPVVARLMEKKASQMGDYPRFEAVVPQATRTVAAAPAGAGRRPSAAADGDDGDGLLADLLPGGEAPAPGQPDTPRGEKPTPIIIPQAGVAAPKPGGGAHAPDEEPVDSPQVPEIGTPVVVAAAPQGPGSPVQPRLTEGAGGFEWEDLLDKRFLALWFAVLALYPLLRRKSG